MWDDHDICDGWGSLPEAALDSPLGQIVFEVAREMFLVFQLGGTPTEPPPLCLDRRRSNPRLGCAASRRAAGGPGPALRAAPGAGNGREPAGDALEAALAEAVARSTFSCFPACPLSGRGCPGWRP
ncbi:MAG: hypothetical protein U5L11_17065 [Arhodomonas sp.]|nr:hypothetical protein [Arhodomonas sp.]